MKYYIASCVFTAKYPELSKRIQDYVASLDDISIVRCCVPGWKKNIYEEKMPQGELSERWMGIPQSHVFLPEEILIRRTLMTLQPPVVDDVPMIEESDIRRNIMDLAIERKIMIKGENRNVYYNAYYYTEAGIARMLHQLNLKGETNECEIEEKIRRVEESENIILDDLQKEAVRQAVNAPCRARSWC